MAQLHMDYCDAAATNLIHSLLPVRSGGVKPIEVVVLSTRKQLGTDRTTPQAQQ